MTLSLKLNKTISLDRLFQLNSIETNKDAVIESLIKNLRSSRELLSSWSIAVNDLLMIHGV